jgi:NUMOD4 motif/HNH endonuclease
MNTKIDCIMEKKKKTFPPIRATIRFSSYPNEIWKEFFPHKDAKRRYMVSNLGRVASFYKDLHVDGYLLKPSTGNPVSGSRIALKIYTKGDRIGRYGEPLSEIENITFPVHNIVAALFLETPTEDQEQVIHLDHDKFNNVATNLRWVTKEEVWQHFKKSERYKIPTKGMKLTADRVRIIKRKLLEGKTKQGLLAKQFGLSEMSIYRIKTGKAWKHITI